MNKTEAINLLGGSLTSAAREIGVTVAAVAAWPDPLPQRVSDRVQAALWRKSQGIPPPTITRRDEIAANHVADAD